MVARSSYRSHAMVRDDLRRISRDWIAPPFDPSFSHDFELEMRRACEKAEVRSTIRATAHYASVIASLYGNLGTHACEEGTDFVWVADAIACTHCVTATPQCVPHGDWASWWQWFCVCRDIPPQAHAVIATLHSSVRYDLTLETHDAWRHTLKIMRVLKALFEDESEVVSWFVPRIVRLAEVR